MFNPFKKKSASLQSVDELLADVSLFDKPIDHWISDKVLHGDVLDLSLTIAKNSNQSELENVYQLLRGKLHAVGVMEINLNVHLSDQNTIPSTDTNEPSPTKVAQKQADIAPHPRIRHIIAIASGKGGVGKSTTCVNIALALQALGKKVGILDADIYGPSVPDMLGVGGVRPTVEHDQFIPIDAGGVATLSIGNLIESDNTPMAWRGIKATGALMQLYSQTNWPTLDYLLIDMPPGTGDIQLTLAQRIPITGAVIVTTPQHIALLDAQKGMELFFKTGIGVIGVVENMALHTCSQCGHTEAIFGEGGGDLLAERYRVPLLGQLPLASGIRVQMDKGLPSVRVDDEFAPFYQAIAKNIDASIGQFDKGSSKRIF